MGTDDREPEGGPRARDALDNVVRLPRKWNGPAGPPGARPSPDRSSDRSPDGEGLAPPGDGRRLRPASEDGPRDETPRLFTREDGDGDSTGGRRKPGGQRSPGGDGRDRALGGGGVPGEDRPSRDEGPPGGRLSDWVGPLEDLVPIGAPTPPEAKSGMPRSAGGAEEVAPGTDRPLPPAALDQLLPRPVSADDFWGEGAGSLHDPVQGPLPGVSEALAGSSELAGAGSGAVWRGPPRRSRLAAAALAVVVAAAVVGGNLGLFDRGAARPRPARAVALSASLLARTIPGAVLHVADAPVAAGSRSRSGASGRKVLRSRGRHALGIRRAGVARSAAGGASPVSGYAETARYSPSSGGYTAPGVSTVLRDGTGEYSTGDAAGGAPATSQGPKPAGPVGPGAPFGPGHLG